MPNRHPPYPLRVYWNSERAREMLGWRPQYDFTQFLRDLGEGAADFVRGNRNPVLGAPAPWRP